MKKDLLLSEEAQLLSIDQSLGDTIDVLSDMMWQNIRNIEKVTFSSKNEQIKALKKLARLIDAYAASREAFQAVKNV